MVPRHTRKTEVEQVWWRKSNMNFPFLHAKVSETCFTPRSGSASSWSQLLFEKKKNDRRSLSTINESVKMVILERPVYLEIKILFFTFYLIQFLLFFFLNNFLIFFILVHIFRCFLRHQESYRSFLISFNFLFIFNFLDCFSLVLFVFFDLTQN